MAFIDHEWKIPTALAWIATRDRAQIDGLDEEATSSIAAAESLVPGVRQALPELMSKAADGTLPVRGRTPDGAYEWIDRTAWVYGEVQEDGHELVVRSQADSKTTSWSILFVRRVAVLAAWPSPLPVWPVFHGTIRLRDLAATIDPTETTRWAELRFGQYSDASYDRWQLGLMISMKVRAALTSGQYFLSSDSGEVDLTAETRIECADDKVERLKPVVIGGREIRPDEWDVIRTWRDVTVRCTDASSAPVRPML